MSVRKAVGIGHLVVTTPVLALILIGAAVGIRLGGVKPGLVGTLVGVVIAWLWWSFTVPRWRRWALASGVDAERLQRLAAATLLVWPRGWFFERTEFRGRDHGRRQ